MSDVADDTLEAKVREGARLMLAAVLDEEFSAFLGRDRYERSDEFCGYRNGYHRSRELTVEVSAVAVKVPRVSDVSPEVSEDGYSSQIVRRYERTSRQTQELFRKLYMEGLSTGGFELVFRELVGETTALSANAIVRLKSRWEDEYREWRDSRLASCRYAYKWAGRRVPWSRRRSGEDGAVVRGWSEGRRDEGAGRDGTRLQGEH